MSKLQKNVDTGLEIAVELNLNNVLNDAEHVTWINSTYTVNEAVAERGIEVNPKKHAEKTPFEILMIGKDHGNEAVLVTVINNTLLHQIRKQNSEYSSVLYGGKPAIIREFVCPSFGHETFDILTKPGAKSWHENIPAFKASFSSKKGLVITRVNIVNEWWRWEERNSYPNGIVMTPNLNPDGAYNLFRGFPIKPRRGDWHLFKKLILEVICDNDNKLCIWVLDWMAIGIQNPETLKGVALVLRGAKGIGKGQFAKFYGKLYGQHFLHIAQDKHLTGNFNAHQAHTLLLFADELIWGGNKSSEGVLKSLITEDSIMLERKGFDPHRIKNNMRLLVASNEAWAVPASAGERRWCVCDCSIKYKEDHKFFAALKIEMNNGGIEALMYELLHRKIKTNQRKAPKTAALTDIAIKGFTPVQKWWYHMLEKGETNRLYASGDRLVDWGDPVSVDALHHSYRSYCISENIRDIDTKSTMSKHTKNLLDLSKPKRQRENNVKVTTYQLPLLDDARKACARAVGLVFDWDD